MNNSNKRNTPLFIIIAIILVFTVILIAGFVFNGPLPTGTDLTRSDWLAFAGNYSVGLITSGVTLIAVLYGVKRLREDLRHRDDMYTKDKLITLYAEIIELIELSTLLNTPDDDEIRLEKHEAKTRELLSLNAKINMLDLYLQQNDASTRLKSMLAEAKRRVYDLKNMWAVIIFDKGDRTSSPSAASKYTFQDFHEATKPLEKLATSISETMKEYLTLVFDEKR